MKKITTAACSALLILGLMAGCSNGGGGSSPQPEADVSLDAILESIRDAYGEDYLPNTDISPEQLESEFMITPDMYEEYLGESPLIGAQPDRVLVIKAAPGKADDIEAALEAARDAKIENELQYPMNVAKTNATLVERHGNYLAFLLVGAPDDRLDADDSQRAAFAREEAQKGAEAFLSNFEQ